MKRLMIVLAVLATAGGLLVGSVRAQAPAAGGGQGASGKKFHPRAATNLFFMKAGPETRMEPGKVVAWTMDDLNAKTSHVQWAPEYRLTMTTRKGLPAGQEPVSGELHEDNTQIYLITKGTGTVLVEGKVDPEEDYLVAAGEHRGGPIVGGRKIRVKPGDLVSIPPFAWHVAWGDPGVDLNYLIIHVHTRQTIP